MFFEPSFVYRIGMSTPKHVYPVIRTDKDKTRDTWSNIALHLRGFSRANPRELQKAKGYI